MLDPVEIDINMNQNVSEEAGKAAAANEEMTKSVDSMQKEIERLNKVVQDMSTALAEQKKLTADNAAEFDDAAKKIDVMQAALDKAKQELAVYQSTCEQMNKAVQSGADVTDVLVDAKDALSQTESTLIDNAKELINNQEGINSMLDEGDKSTNTYSASNKILSASIKEVCKGLGIENTQVVNSIGNVRVIQSAKIGWSNAVKILNTQLGLTITQSKILLGLGLATGIGLLIAVFAAAAYAINDWNKNTQDLTQSMAEFNKSAASGAAKQRAEFEKLRQQWVEAGNDLEKKEKLVQKNIEAYNEFGVEVNNVNDAEKIFIDNADSIIESINKRAMAIAAMQLASKKYEEALQNMLDAEEKQANPSSWTKFKAMFIGKVKGEDRMNVLQDIIDDEVDDLTTAAERANRAAQNYISYALGIDKETAKKVEKGSKEFYQEIVSYNQKLIDNMTADQLKSAAGRKAVQERDKAQNMLSIWGKTPKSPKKPKVTDAEKAASSLEKKSYEYQKRIDAARVKAIHEGAEHERQAAKAELDQTRAFMEKEYKSISELEKKTGKPATEQRTMLVELDVEAVRQYNAEIARIDAKSKATLDSIFSEVNARFASELEQNIANINRYYTELIKDATKAGATIEEVNALQAAKEKDIDRAGIDDKLRKTDLDEALEMEKANNLAAVGLTTIAEEAKLEITKKYLKQRIDLLRKLGDESSNKEADILETRLKGVQSSPKSISGLVNTALFDKIKKGFEKTGASAEEAREKTMAVFSSIQQGGATAVSAVGDLKGMFGGLDEGLDKALDAVGNIAQGFASGGIVGGAMAVIGEGIKMFTSAAQVEKEHQEALRKLALAKLEMQREYNLLLLKEQLIYKQGANIFGADQIRGAANSILTYRESIAQLKKEMQGTRPDDSLVSVYEKLASGGGVMASIGKQRLDEYKKQQDAYEKGIGALANVDIVTGSRKSGWGFWRKQKDVYSSLLDTYDDVIDSEGKLNTNRIQAILNTHKMSDENKALLESLLSLSEAAEEAEEQLKNYLTETFGGLGDALADSIVTAFRTGEDAAQMFKGNVTDVLNDLAKQMVFALYLKDTFDKLEKDIEKAYTDLADDKLTEEQLSNKITDILGGFFGGLDGDIEKANKFLEEFWKNAEANGFDRPEGERQGAKGSLVNASQDSINELTGGVYAVRQIIGDIRNDNREELLVQRTIMGQLSVLVERSEYWQHLKELPRVVKKLEDIEAYGLRVKSVI